MADTIPIPTPLMALQQRLDTLESSRHNGGGNGGGGMEARVAKLEAGMEHVIRELGDVKQDIREIKGDIKSIHKNMSDLRKDMNSGFFRARTELIALAVGLAGLMAKGFHWL